MISIKSIEFFDHHFFENQKFDFTLDGNNLAKNIIIAGENGSGKTKFLEELYKISNEIFYIIDYEYPKKTHEIVLDISTENYVNFDNEDEKITDLIFTIWKDNEEDEHRTIKCMSKTKKINEIKKKNTTNKIEKFKINGLYSNVDINYNPRNKVKGASSETIDTESSELPKDLAFEITQLLVNITIQDSCDVDAWVSKNRNCLVPENVFHTRLKRFINAYKTIFESNIIYKGLKNNSIPIFEKDNNEIEIDSLSSGEKQIIFRGTYLLKNKNSLKGVPIFIDEPEISMHPKWEEKIFDYYREIFSENSVQTSQIFIATHSEHILSSALNKEDCLVIKIKNNKYEKFYKNGPGTILPTITNAEIKLSIFDMYTIDFHTLLYGYIQQNYVKDSSGNLINDPNIAQTDQWLKTQNVTLKAYQKQTKSRYIRYDTLQTYIRNCIDHPDSSIVYSSNELITSIDEMINCIKNPI